MIAEEVLVQHPQVDRLNPNCINTVRVATYTDRDDVHMVLATLRSARGDAIVDNFAAGGIHMAVDVETGVICSDATDEQMRVYPTHPLTGTKLEGLPAPELGQGAGRPPSRLAGYVRVARLPLSGLGHRLPQKRRSLHHRVQLAAGRRSPAAAQQGHLPRTRRPAAKSSERLADRKTASTFALWKQFLFPAGKLPGFPHRQERFPRAEGFSAAPAPHRARPRQCAWRCQSGGISAARRGCARVPCRLRRAAASPPRAAV